MEMSAFDNEHCFAVALYGSSLASTNVVPFASEVVEMFRTAGQQPSHMTATARGFGKNPSLFDGAWKRLQRAAPDDVQSVGIHCLIDNWNTLSDWTATCDIYRDWGGIVLGAGLATMPKARPQLLGLVRRWLDRIRPAYGIGFLRARGRGPGFYSIGCSYNSSAHSGPEYEEDLATCRWADGMDEAVYDQGILRDVYRYSLLTPRHLQRHIDGRPLWAWIQETPQRGQLAPFADSGDYTLWTVAPDHLAAVRRQLAAAGGLYVLERVNHL